MAFLDFLERCLAWDPRHRMKPHEALTHPFVTNTRYIPGVTDRLTYTTRDRDTLSAKRKENSNSGSVSLETDFKKVVIPHPTYGTLKSKLPAVSSFAKFGSQISKAVGMSKERNDFSLPPIEALHRSAIVGSSRISKVSYPSHPTWR